MRSLELKLGLLVGPFLLALTAACSSEPGEIEGPANKAAMLADSSTSGPLFEVDPFWQSRCRITGYLARLSAWLSIPETTF